MLFRPPTPDYDKISRLEHELLDQLDWDYNEVFLIVGLAKYRKELAMTGGYNRVVTPLSSWSVGRKWITNNYYITFPPATSRWGHIDSFLIMCSCCETRIDGPLDAPIMIATGNTPSFPPGAVRIDHYMWSLLTHGAAELDR